MKLAIEILLVFFASLNLLFTRFALIRLHQPTTLFMWLIKVFISALSPVLFLAGLSSVILGLVLNSLPAITITGLSTLLYLVQIIKTTRPPEPSAGFEKAFGKEFENHIPGDRKKFLLAKRYVFYLPESPEPVLTQNICFHTIKDSNRQVLCDVWQPPKNITPSGLAFIYLHGSAWAVLDKDFGTRIFFRRLTSQGHVIMDVAYRLFPEADFMDMVNDTKHAIVWLRAHAAMYHVNPERIVIGGGSAGAQLALLAAYTDKNKQLTPSDLENMDISVRGVVSLYGQSDLSATYYHTCQHMTVYSALAQKKTNHSGGKPSWLQKKMGTDFHRLGFDKNVEPGMLAPMLGGTPDEKPEAYSMFSPITYVHGNCPATLFIHGEHDILAPLNAIRKLQERLTKEGVKTVMHVFPKTDHAFDLILPKLSPSAQNAIYDVERFLAVMA